MNFGTAHFVGHRYPLVHAPHDMKRLHMGTMSTVRQERRLRKGCLRGTQRTVLLALAAGVPATVGLVVSPA
ncbi:hypothetical protein [Streptomyces nojiriensis]|uniref:hypothetical protein n=1 Tax=Streptomyces nojiriensis TaxID=66374 RepID=UPI001679B8B2|nr:hypothetical protein [Streptomyces nojiriensis]